MRCSGTTTSSTLWTHTTTSVLRPPCGFGNTLSCHSTPQTWDGFRTCSLNWFILVAPKSCGGPKAAKIPCLKRKQMSGCVGVLILHLSISPKIPSPHVCEEAAAAAQWGQMAVSGNGGQTASPATCHHPAPAGHRQPLSSSRSQLRLPSQPQTTYTHVLWGPKAQSASWILLLSWQPLAELISCWHLGIMSTAVLILAHLSIGSFSNECSGYHRGESGKGSRASLQPTPRQS